jgi:hypothetical protein
VPPHDPRLCRIALHYREPLERNHKSDNLVRRFNHLPRLREKELLPGNIGCNERADSPFFPDIPKKPTRVCIELVCTHEQDLKAALNQDDTSR